MAKLETFRSTGTVGLCKMLPKKSKKCVNMIIRKNTPLFHSFFTPFSLSFHSDFSFFFVQMVNVVHVSRLIFTRTHMVQLLQHVHTKENHSHNLDFRIFWGGSSLIPWKKGCSEGFSFIAATESQRTIEYFIRLFFEMFVRRLFQYSLIYTYI